MIKKFILVALLSTCLMSPVMTLANMTPITVSAATDEEVAPYSPVYEWYYKEINGVKFMRLWDNRNCCWVTNWIPVQS